MEPRRLVRLAATLLFLLAVVAISRRRQPSCPNPAAADVTLPEDSITLDHLGRELQEPGSSGNVVLANAAGVPTSRLAVFVRAWAEHSPATQLVIFTEQATLANSAVKRLYDDFRVIAVPFEAPPELEDPSDPEDFAKPGRLPLHTLEKYLAYIETEGLRQGVRGVAIVLDAGGVVVQSDPFLDPGVRAAIDTNGVVLSYEGGPQLGAVKAGDNEHVIKAVNSCFGSGVADKIAEEPLFNADVVFASATAARGYLFLISDVLATRVRSRCLRAHRADRAALQYAIQDFGADRKSLDFVVYLRDHINSTALGAAFGLPAHVDSRGVLHRGIMAGGSRRGLTPSVITAYHTHPHLLRYYLARYGSAVLEVDFVQRSGYIGELMIGSEELPELWNKAVALEYEQLNGDSRTEPVTLDRVIDAMVLREKRRKKQLMQEAKAAAHRAAGDEMNGDGGMGSVLGEGETNADEMQRPALP